MSGTAIIRYLLTNNGALTAVVPAAKIVTGQVKLNTVLPAISVMKLSASPRITVAMSEASYMVTEYVQVTVFAKTYQSKEAVFSLVRAALPVSRGTVNGFSCDSVLLESEGPDLEDSEDDVVMQTHDFVVKFNR